MSAGHVYNLGVATTVWQQKVDRMMTTIAVCSHLIRLFIVYYSSGVSLPHRALHSNDRVRRHGRRLLRPRRRSRIHQKVRTYVILFRYGSRGSRIVVGI